MTRSSSSVSGHDAGACARRDEDNALACGARSETGVIGRDGGFAEYVASAARFVHRLTADADLRIAVLCEPLAVVLKGLRRAGLSASMRGRTQRCAVVGGGTVGYLATRLLESWGHDVTVFERDMQRHRLYQRVGTDVSELAQMDLIVEASGNQEALDAVLQWSRPGSRILLLGLPYEKRAFSFESIVAFDRPIIGSVGSSAVDFAEAVRAISVVGTVPWGNLDCVVPLTEFDRALDLARSRRHLKIFVEVDALLNSTPDVFSAHLDRLIESASHASPAGAAG